MTARISVVACSAVILLSREQAVFRFVKDLVWAFDAEWVPDPGTGRRVYGLPGDWPDMRVVEEMWRRGGASAEDPRPFLKTALCRVVSIAVVVRQRAENGRINLKIYSVPNGDEGALPEAQLIERFLKGVGTDGPQLVGFNSFNSDLNIIVQRAVANGLQSARFCKRPAKPWDDEPDYFSRQNEYSIDLQAELSAWGKGTPSLHEMATACGIPGKIDTDGTAVADLWSAGDVHRIVQYNQCDAITTYLLWLRLAHFAGHISSEQYREEQEQLERLLRDLSAKPGNEHFERYLSEWGALRDRR
jgi:predicted PolB exonuclease-like 3'-5' exonuclease